MPMFKRKGINVHSGIYVKEMREESGEKVLVAETKQKANGRSSAPM